MVCIIDEAREKAPAPAAARFRSVQTEHGVTVTGTYRLEPLAFHVLLYICAASAVAAQTGTRH